MRKAKTTDLATAPRFNRTQLLQTLRDSLSPKDRPILDNVVRNHSHGQLDFETEARSFGTDAWTLKARCVGLDNVRTSVSSEITKPSELPKVAILKLLFG